MSDEPDNTPEENEDVPTMGMIQFVPFGQPMTKEQRDQHNAEIDATAHRGVSFFDSLNEEQLLTLRNLLMVMHNEPMKVLPYYVGVVSTQLQQRFGVCPACTKKHDDELEKLVEVGQAEMSHGQADTDDEELALQAVAWGVSFDPKIADGRPLSLVPVFCNEICGATWPNMADRMLRKPGPDGCPGCQEKAKFG